MGRVELDRLVRVLIVGAAILAAWVAVGVLFFEEQILMWVIGGFALATVATMFVMPADGK